MEREQGRSDDCNVQQQQQQPNPTAADKAGKETDEVGALFSKWWGDREESLLHPLQVGLDM